ncbi:MAG: tetratricopeptide repeat protein [Acidobacteriota bacterium]
MQGARALAMLPLVLASAALVSHASSSNRQIALGVLADEEFRDDNGWSPRVDKVIDAVSREFGRLFHIEFRVARQAEWQSPDDLDSLDLLAERADQMAGRAEFEVLVVFTAQRGLKDTLRGCSLSEPAVIAVRQANTAEMIGYLRHEMAHVFGAVHLFDRTSLMDILGRGTSFDEITSKIISLNRERKFNTPESQVASERLAELAKVYQKVSDSIDPSTVKSYFGPAAHAWTKRHNAPEDAGLQLSQVYLELRRYQDARRECLKAAYLAPDNLEARNVLAIIERRTGHVEEAVLIYKEILGRRPLQPQVYYNLGIAYAKLGRLDDAVAAYQRSIELKPNYAAARCNLGEIYLRRNEVEKAEGELAAAVAEAPQFALAHSNLAETYARKNDLLRAATEIEKAIALNPALAAAHNVKGGVLYKQGRLEDAMREYELALSLDDQQDKASFNLGNCYLDAGQGKKARACFEKAVALNPQLGEAHAALGYCDLLDGAPAQAAERILHAHQLGYRSAKSCVNLSTAMLQQRRIDEAIAAAKESIELDPSAATAYSNLGVAYAAAGRTNDAIEQCEKSLAIEPRNRDAYTNLGALYMQIGDQDRAIETYGRAVGADPDCALFHNNLAVLYFRRGRYADAWQHAQRAKSLGFKVHPDFLAQLAERIKGDRQQ